MLIEKTPGRGIEGAIEHPDQDDINVPVMVLELNKNGTASITLTNLLEYARKIKSQKLANEKGTDPRKEEYDLMINQPSFNTSRISQIETRKIATPRLEDLQKALQYPSLAAPIKAKSDFYSLQYVQIIIRIRPINTPGEYYYLQLTMPYYMYEELVRQYNQLVEEHNARQTPQE